MSTFTVRIKTPVGAPVGYAAHQLQAARREVGNKLYEILYSQKLPAVVDIEEKELNYSANFSYPPENEMQIEVTVTPVNHRHITFAHADSFNFDVHRKDWRAKLARWLLK